MTFSLRRKRQITARAAIRWWRTAISLLAGWLGTLAVGAQEIQHATTYFPAAPGVGNALYSTQGAVQNASEFELRTGQPPTILRTAAQLGLYQKPGEEDTDFYIQTDLPGPQRLFRRESEKQMFERLRLEGQQRTGSTRVTFPEYPPLTKEQYSPRAFAKMVEMVEPAYVCHHKLYFEQLNFDRYGWELGYLQPGVSTAIFWYDVAMLPYHIWTRPCECIDCSAGKCLPGDCVPLRLYPEEFSITGLAAEASVIGFGFFIFP